VRTELLAERLAAAPSELAAIRRKLEEQRDSCPLFDTDRFRRHIEAVLRPHVEAASAGKAAGKLPCIRAAVATVRLACSAVASAQRKY
jgi:hypothetical protein